MTILMVPPEDTRPWPTLGPQVCRYIETNLVFGPGDLGGQRAVLDPEKRALVYSFYEVYPEDARDANGKPIGGRRRFRRCGWSAQKGSAKTELAAWIAACELAPDAPVRCDRFVNGKPVGRPVQDPYIPMVAFTEEQTSDLAYGALKAILDNSPIRHMFDIAEERIKRANGTGKAVALAGAPDSRDGARTTFAHKDETHRWATDRLRKAHSTMVNNLPKRLIADPWELETTTAYVPGERSVAEMTMAYAAQVASGAIADSRLFYFHRQASDGYDLDDADQRRAAVLEAAGPTASWKDIEGICDLWQDPEADREYLERVWLNRPVATAAQAFNVSAWEKARRDVPAPAPGRLITIGFDGSLTDDATAAIGTDVETGLQFPLGIWERPYGQEEWTVDKAEVCDVIDEAFRRWNVFRMYADPSRWEGQTADWAGRYGVSRVVEWPTRLTHKMAVALKTYATAIAGGEVTHNGDKDFARHVANAQKNVMRNLTDDDGSPLWLIQKDRPGSTRKIDAAMAGCLSWQARLDAIAKGALSETTASYHVYELDF